jgi:hypothetical protein
MNNPKTVVPLSSTAVRGKRFEVNDLNHSATDTQDNVKIQEPSIDLMFVET